MPDDHIPNNRTPGHQPSWGELFPLHGHAENAAHPEQQGASAASVESADERDPRVADSGQRRGTLITVGVVVVVVVAVAGVLLAQNWSGSNQSGLALAILNVQLIGGIVPPLVFVLAVAAIAVLLLRRPKRRWLIADAIGVGAGVLVGVTILWIVAATNALGVALSVVSTSWIIAGFAGIGLGVASFVTVRGWRIAVASSCILLSIAAGTIGVNADFGLDPTVAALAGVSTTKIITLPKKTATPTPIPTLKDGGALWANWVAPAGMPTRGTESRVDIPNTASGFNARPAGLYLPPAALVKNPPALPLVIMMMGQPGNPDPTFQAAILNEFAARHNGLAPIVIVADQIGNPSDDPLCTDDTRYGRAETYITQDVVGWARTHLNILQDSQDWTIEGYSNGGECAFSLGAQYPNIWGNVVDISGELYPGSDQASSTLYSVFHGNRAAYEAVWPSTILRHGTYPDMVGIFTVSTNDYQYLPQARQAASDAEAAHWKTTLFEVPNGGHVLGALNGGISEGYTILYPLLGLSAPGVAP